MRPSALIYICLIFGLMFAACTGAQAISTGKLYDLGYSYQMYPGVDFSAPWVDFQGSYSHVASSGNVIGQVEIRVPYNNPSEILYYNYKLSDGSVHKGSYQSLQSNQYTIYLDGASVTGNYTYTVMDELMQFLGVYDHNYVYVLYASNLSNRMQTAVYVVSQAYNNGPSIDAKAQVLLLPLSSTGTAITSFSASSNYLTTIQCGECTLTDLVNHTQNEPGVPASWAANQTTGTGISFYLNFINKFVGTLITVGTAMVELVLLIFFILQFLIDPYNIILILILFEEFAAIVALSSRGDIFVSMGKFANYNVAMFTFMIFMAKGMVQVISYTIQALAMAVQAGAQLAQAGADIVKGVASWLLTLLVLIPK